VARKLARKKHDRDIYFLATTAEESGLLGARHFASNPPFALGHMAVALNLDTAAVAPKGSSVAVIGEEQEWLKPILQKMLRRQRRSLAKSNEANIFLRRQDGWALTQNGYPAYMVSSAFGDLDLLSEFLEGEYHGPADELRDETQLGGATQDANLHVRLGRYFASLRKNPELFPPQLKSPSQLTRKSAEDSGAR